MTRTFPMMAVAVGVGLLTGLAGASPVLVDTTFENYNAGESLDAAGQPDVWSVSLGTAMVVDDSSATPPSGSKFVSLGTNTIIDRTVTASGESVVWTESYFRGAGTDEAPDYPTGSGNEASAIVHFSSNASEGILLLDGDGAGGGSFVESGVKPIDPNHWYRITIRQDYTGHTWDCWIDGQLAASNLGFRDDINALGGFREYAGVPSSMDSFKVRRRSNGDLDENGVTDAADVVLNVNAQGQEAATTTLGPFGFDDADFNEDGVVTSDDTTATADIILNN
jgi:hypothetical protein